MRTPNLILSSLKPHSQKHKQKKEHSLKHTLKHTLLEAIAFSKHNNSTIMTQVEVEEDISLVGNNGGFNSVDGSANAEAKKKKKKKKRSKKKKAAPPTNSGQESNAGLSHQQLVLRSVMSEGYNEDEVNKAVGEMWDKSLMYDNVKAVLKYLNGEKGGDDEDSDDEEKERKPRVEKEKEEEEKKEPPSASSSPSNSAPKVAQPSSPKGQAVASPEWRHGLSSSASPTQRRTMRWPPPSTPSTPGLPRPPTPS